MALIDLHDRDTVTARRPLLIAHRGGVVTAASPENSGAAIRLAAEQGYDMVELDVRLSRDGEPVLFHGVRGRLHGTSGGDAPVAALSTSELGRLRYGGTDEPILTLAEGLALSRSLGLGVMLDVKVGEVEVTRELAMRIAGLLDGQGLQRAAMTISHVPILREVAGPALLYPLDGDALRRLAAGERPDRRGFFWFGIPRQLPEALIGPVGAAGALVIPAINVFRYRRADAHSAGRADIERLMALGVDGFQIDADYRDAFPAPA